MTFGVIRSFNKVKSVNLLLLLLIIISSGCASWMGFPTYYDPTTYKNLTDLKPDVLMLYDSFAKESLDEKRIERLNLKLAQVYEYEKGKGDKNKETYLQVEMIRDMYERHIEDRLENGIWSAIHLDNQKENIADAFDIAIRTESQKNKND